MKDKTMTKKKYLNFLRELKNVFPGDKEAQVLIRSLELKVETAPIPEAALLAPIKNFTLPAEIRDVKHHFALFCDGACRGNPGPGAWSVLGQGGQGEILFEGTGVDYLTTNNKMELEAAIQSLERIQDHLVDADGDKKTKVQIFLYSDSKYVVEGIEKWLPGWKAKGWKKADKTSPENLDKWQRLDELKNVLPSLRVLWVKGHSGHPQNDYCDRMANEALDEAGL
jgi:ribonuclease HI